MGGGGGGGRNKWKGGRRRRRRGETPRYGAEERVTCYGSFKANNETCHTLQPSGRCSMAAGSWIHRRGREAGPSMFDPCRRRRRRFDARFCPSSSSVCDPRDPRRENHHIINFGPQGPLRPQGPQISEVMFFSHVRTPKFITSLNRAQDESQGPN